MLKIIKYLSFFYLFVIGCSGNETEVPPEIESGRYPCDNCQMIIHEKNYAASIITDNNITKLFDDIGCLIDYENKNNPEVKSRWVYDYLTEKPVKTEKAFFVESDNFETPMGFGIVAFESPVSAKKYAEGNKTEAVSFGELKQKYSRPSK